MTSDAERGQVARKTGGTGGRMSFCCIGKGRFGTLLIEKFSRFGDCAFTADKGDDYVSQLDTCDWAVIATPAPTHYGIAKTCLETGKDVFCEKPLASSLSQTEELYAIAVSRGRKLYCDDVFLHREEYAELKSAVEGMSPKRMRFIWKKYGEFKDTIGNDLLYHDLYMLHSLFPDGVLNNIVVHRSDEHALLADATLHSAVGELAVEFEYRKDFDGKLKIVEVTGEDGAVVAVDFSNPKNDALSVMIRGFLSDDAQFTRNERVTRSAMRSLEMFR